jgi:hypothetical protein
MSADEFSDWSQKSDKTSPADAQLKRAYGLAATALVVALSALVVSALVLIVSLSTSLSPKLEPPTAVTPSSPTSPSHASDVMKTVQRAH